MKKLRIAGELGREIRVISPLKKDIFGKGLFGFSEEEQHFILERASQRYGKNKINPQISRDTEDLRRWISRNFDGKKKITDA